MLRCSSRTVKESSTTSTFGAPRVATTVAARRRGAGTRSGVRPGQRRGIEQQGDAPVAEDRAAEVARAREASSGPSGLTTTSSSPSRTIARRRRPGGRPTRRRPPARAARAAAPRRRAASARSASGIARPRSSSDGRPSSDQRARRRRRPPRTAASGRPKTLAAALDEQHVEQRERERQEQRDLECRRPARCAPRACRRTTRRAA